MNTARGRAIHTFVMIGWSSLKCEGSLIRLIFSGDLHSTLKGTQREAGLSTHSWWLDGHHWSLKVHWFDWSFLTIYIPLLREEWIQQEAGLSTHLWWLDGHHWSAKVHWFDWSFLAIYIPLLRQHSERPGYPHIRDDWMVIIEVWRFTDSIDLFWRSTFHSWEKNEYSKRPGYPHICDDWMVIIEVRRFTDSIDLFWRSTFHSWEKNEYSKRPGYPHIRDDWMVIIEVRRFTDSIDLFWRSTFHSWEKNEYSKRPGYPHIRVRSFLLTLMDVFLGRR
jgi:hypothetical protein